MTYKNLILEQSKSIANVILNRPDVRNAFNAELIQEMTQCFQTLSEDSNVRVVVLRGAGSVFCAGADINWMRDSVIYSQEQNREDALKMARMYQTIDLCTKPVIGRIQKAAFGGAVGLAAVCDVVVASDDAKFSFSEVRLGIVPAVISSFSLRKVGVSQARRYFMSGEVFNAKRAQEIGLIHEVVPTEQLDEAVDQLVTEFLKSGPNAMMESKLLINKVPELSYEEAIQHCVDTIARIRTSPEGQEGLNAFLEKRKPGWTLKESE